MTLGFDAMGREAVQALFILFDPARLMFLVAGVLLGLTVGVIPGLSGLVGLTLLLPFTYAMDPYSALAMMLGLGSVTVTGDTIPAVLFGVPGTTGSAATILDGYPLARRGEASRAFGAAFSASVFGGLFGALLLGISLPILRPFMLSFSQPEMLAICVFGLSLVAVLSGNAPLKGVIAACLGILIATIGEADGQLRLTFETEYLWDGMPLVPFALGIFAIPELADMMITRKSVAGGNVKIGRAGQLQGIRDVLRNWFLVLRCGFIGAGLGSIPGIGASVVDWVAYGHAARTEKDAEKTFGKGDIRGLIASESSNNAKEGGALVPTIAFGVPGSASMALLLGAFLIHGIVPGPKMLTEHLDVTYTMVWSVAIANIIGAGLCFAFAGELAKIATIRSGILVPVVLAIVFLGAFQGQQSWVDLYVLIIFGTLGWLMKRLRWPRPPLVLGFVLGGLIERYLFISISRWEFDWLLRPIVVIILAITVLSLLLPIVSRLRQQSASGGTGLTFGLQSAYLRNPDLFFSILITFVFAFAAYSVMELDYQARLAPSSVGFFGVALTLLLVLFSAFTEPAKPTDSSGVNTTDQAHFDIQADYGDLPSRTVYARAARFLLWCLGYVVLAHAIGMLPALLVFLVVYMLSEGQEKVMLTVPVALGLSTFCYVMFHIVLRVPWPRSMIGTMYPYFRGIREFNIF